MYRYNRERGLREMEDEIKELQQRLFWLIISYTALVILVLLINREVDEIKRKVYGVVAREETDRRNIETLFRRLEPAKPEPSFVEVEVPPPVT